jgi:RNA polymerase sigma-70 factor (ECF subfamily)
VIRLIRSKDLKSVLAIQATEAAEFEIVRRAQSGERRAFDLLVFKHQSRILSLLTRYTRNPSDAEDVSQETFLKAYRGLKQFRCESNFYTWLHRIAINSANSLLKARARDFSDSTWHVLTSSDGTAEVPPQLREVGTPEQAICADEIRGLVDTTLASLPPGHRAAIMMREVDGLSYAAIATAMLIPIGTVRSRVFRARQLLDRQLRQVVDGGLGRCLTRRMSSSAVATRSAAYHPVQ